MEPPGSRQAAVQGRFEHRGAGLQAGQGGVTGEHLEKLFWGQAGMGLECLLHVRLALAKVVGEVGQAGLVRLVGDKPLEGVGNRFILSVHGAILTKGQGGATRFLCPGVERCARLAPFFTGSSLCRKIYF